MLLYLLVQTMVKDGPFCEVCEIGAQYLQSYLNNNETKAQAKGYLLQVCQMLPIPAIVQEVRGYS